MKIAQIKYQDLIFEGRSGSPSRNGILRSPVRALIEGVYETRISDARYILREPIILNYQPTEAEKAMIKVGAKRYRVADISSVSNAVAFEAADDLNSSCDDQVPTSKKFESLDNAVRAFKEQSATAGVQVAHFSKDHVLKRLAGNTNSRIKTRHAEVNLIRQSLAGVKEGDYILVSLQSCRMCAAALKEWFADRDVKVYFLAHEPNLKNVKTALYGIEAFLE